jgi:hypothetical protein
MDQNVENGGNNGVPEKGVFFRCRKQTEYRSENKMEKNPGFRHQNVSHWFRTE